MTKEKKLILLLLITSLMGYMEWGGNNHIFLAQAEVEAFKNLFSNPTSALHPFILIPFAGQVLLLVNLLRKQPHKAFTYIGTACLGILLGFMFIIGVTTVHFKIIISTLPFLITAVVMVRYYRELGVE
ncbi:hypothetical protein [Mucilaginibacter auburnensis]|uniref:DoxX-like protein n=1 Tax=Mucilaginibacter auburnensis TaxID=1457233 RepID=A0A2H9VP55_9SPHI|nr:hypothetical protein [Mucilaginibacter auburnensis]PJJ80092.1 hypothetical protein CLV57_3236 [Mucilaginibacter auburnensis]